MLEKNSLRKRRIILVLLFFGLLLGATWAQTETVLYSFCAQKNCADGATPVAGMVLDHKGDLYGTTQYGGAYGAGTVFKLTPRGKETVLYSFCAQQINCVDGAQPLAGLVFDQRGNLYGTTVAGGAYERGIVFKLTPKGKETVVYSFCAQTGCADGADPSSGLVFDKKGNLYGTTSGGLDNRDCHEGCGIVFKLTPRGKETVVYSFCSQQINCVDGWGPAAGLIFDQNGNLYGSTANGGFHNSGLCYYGCGVLFKLTPEGKYTALYSFCAHVQGNCADGAYPGSGLILDQKGNLYGTTYGGGIYNDGCPYGCAVAFKLTPDGKETVLYSFCAETYCADGLWPHAGLILDQNGNLYGTASEGGAHNDCDYYGCGVVFKLTPKGKETILHTLEGSDGAAPGAGLVFDRKGNLYGTTVAGGAYNNCNDNRGGCGVVFKLTP
jgi:uncharacterized repeat protein (TIGR03803 family)